MDEEEYIEYIENWSEKLAEHIASKEGVALTQKHWNVIRFARKFYDDNLIDPSVRDIERNINISREELLELFPRGAKQVCKIAGIPYTGCV